MDPNKTNAIAIETNLRGRRPIFGLGRGDEHHAAHRPDHHLVVSNGLHAGIERVNEDVLGTKVLVKLQKEGGRE